SNRYSSSWRLHRRNVPPAIVKRRYSSDITFAAFFLLVLALAGIATIFCRCRDDPAAVNPAIPLLTLRWTFPAKRASVVVTDSESGRLAPLPPPSALWPPWGLGSGRAMLRRDAEPKR